MPKRSRPRLRRDRTASVRQLWFNRWLFATWCLAAHLIWYGYARWLPVLLAICVSVLLVVIWWRNERTDRAERDQLRGSFQDDLDVGRFEDRAVILLRDLGWTNVRRTGQTGDCGVDVRGDKDGQPWVVPCKHYVGSGTPIGEPLIRNFYGARMHEGAAGGVFITISTFTAQARHWAAGKPIVRWDASELGHQIAARTPMRRKRTFPVHDGCAVRACWP